ncbi:hypothetical protein C8J57DRAFT_1535720 [Mycena rebaudengoi]|nr:hypothetical protein C8J57DRAFT_1535720 [Mycena rebaudengoi]
MAYEQHASMIRVMGCLKRYAFFCPTAQVAEGERGSGRSGLGAAITAVLTVPAKKKSRTGATATTAATAAARKDKSRAITGGVEVPKRTRKKKAVSAAHVESSGEEEQHGHQDATTQKAADTLHRRRADLIAQAPNDKGRKAGKAPKKAGPSKPHQSQPQQAMAGPSKSSKFAAASGPRGFAALDAFLVSKHLPASIDVNPEYIRIMILSGFWTKSLKPKVKTDRNHSLDFTAHPPASVSGV